MEENLFDEFPEEIQNGLHDIIKNQLNKKNPTIRVAPASKSGINNLFSTLKNLK